MNKKHLLLALIVLLAILTLACERGGGGSLGGGGGKDYVQPVVTAHPEQEHNVPPGPDATTVPAAEIMQRFPTPTVAK